MTQLEVTTTANTSVTLPPTPEIRKRLAFALREVKTLRGLLRLSEKIKRTAGPPSAATTGALARG
jgi:hypothetical protein